VYNLKKIDIRVISVSEEKVDHIFNIIMQLFIVYRKLASILNTSINENISFKVLTEAERVLKMLYEEIYRIRLIPLSLLFKKLERTIYSLANDLGKLVRVKISGGNIKVDRKILDALMDPLFHIVRNAVDHGIESPTERRKKGKEEIGLITIEAIQIGSHIRISVSDDGKGINPLEIIEKAVEKGILPKNKKYNYSWNDVVYALTTPGFTTKKSITGISGRGVGLDVVKAKVEELGGRLNIISEVGKGTKIILDIPFLASVTKCILFEHNNFLFALPLKNVEHIYKGCSSTFIHYNNKIISLNFLEKRKGNYTIIVRTNKGILKGICVDRILGNENIIIRPVPSLVLSKSGKYINGLSIYHDGRVIYIIDPDRLLALKEL